MKELYENMKIRSSEVQLGSTRAGSTVIQHFLTLISLILCFLISFYSILFTADLFITWISDKKKKLKYAKLILSICFCTNKGKEPVTPAVDAVQ